MKELRNVERATAKVVAAQTQQRQAMLEASRAGASTRKIADAADVSHTQVQRIVNTEGEYGPSTAFVKMLLGE